MYLANEQATNLFLLSKAREKSFDEIWFSIIGDTTDTKVIVVINIGIDINCIVINIFRHIVFHLHFGDIKN